ncbi:hypothetical protein RKE25_12390 [Dyella sp. BiH032]|uniref:terpene synthase family protein n=1 Tax=Dyella sp. BiH032 TaxID=3075430 RepID=UPI002892E916|nr:hypothetical protein [Dyella sp. BiH032]WNL44226.1 hypothetical protein RKE25_12390 [Dyella sp. BiH032]
MQTQAMPCPDAAVGHFPFVAPRLTLKPAWHPQHEAIERRLAQDDWPYILRHFGDERMARKFIAQRIPAYGLLCYPHALPDRIYTIGRMMNVTTVMDDAFTPLARPGMEKESAALRLHFEEALHGVQPPAAFPSAQLLHDALAPMRPQLAARPAVWRRLAASIAEQIAMQAESTAIDVDRLSLAAYLALRRIEGFGHWITMLTEYAIDVDMTSAFERDPALWEVRDATIDSVILVNDLFSFRKEAAKQERFNAVWVLSRELGLDATQALQHLSGLCERNEERLLAASARVLAGPLGGRPDVQAYVTELAHMSSGNAAFHEFSARYRVGDG